MKKGFYKGTVLAIVLLVLSSFANAGIILGDLSSDGSKNPTCSEQSDTNTKVDNGVIVTFTGVIVTFTGVIVTFADDKNEGPVDCGIILTD